MKSTQTSRGKVVMKRRVFTKKDTRNNGAPKKAAKNKKREPTAMQERGYSMLSISQIAVELSLIRKRPLSKSFVAGGRD